MTGIAVPESLPPGHPAGEVEDIFAEVYGWLDCLRSAHKVEARMAAVKTRFAAELAESIVFEHSDSKGVFNGATDEVAMALGVSRFTAKRLVRVGVATKGMLTATGKAFEAGDIAFEKAWVLVDCLDGIAPQVAWAVEDLILPTAAERTPAELRHAIARALVELDPEAADSRHVEAREKRFVSRPEVRADGMAHMSVFLPADQAVALDCALDSVAAAALTAGDERTRAQVRVDALGEWARRTLERGWRFTTTEGADVRSAPTRVNVTVPLEVLARAVPGWQCPTSVATILGAREGFGDVDGVAGPLDGHRTEAAWLEGYGPIAPQIALLLAAGGTWRRIVTDPATGAPLDVGRQRYRPPAHIAEAVRLRDRTCTRPTCTVPARRCELDHVHDWHLGGGTSADELTCLSTRCHRAKTVGAGRPGSKNPDGTRDWISATGRVYRNHPERPPRLRGRTDEGGSYDDDGPPPY